MQWLTFNKMYAAMVLVALVSVLVAPKSLSDKARAQLQRGFAPVSQPVRWVAGAVSARLEPAKADPESLTGQRTYREIADENQQLRLQVAHLTEQFRQLQQINADREALGALREACRPMRVASADPGLRRAISLTGSIEGMKPGMAVLYRGGLAGRIDRVGWTSGAQAQLVTDGAFRITVKFGRLGKDGAFALLGETTTLLTGDNANGMVAKTMTLDDTQKMGLAPGDWAVVADEEYPSVLQGYRVGQIELIKPGREPLFAEIIVKPAANLVRLSEVMVLVR